MDLYSDARLFPHLVRGDLALRTRDELMSGGLSRAALRWRVEGGRPGLARATREVYLQGRQPPDLVDRARAALAVCPAGTVLGHHTAAALFGFGVIESQDVHVVVPAGAPVPQRRGIVVHQATVPTEIVTVRGLPCVMPARCAIDLARLTGRLDALPVLDAALSSLALDRTDLEREIDVHTGLRGVRQVRELVPLADGRAECKQESQLRLLLLDGGVRGFVPQLEVRGAGGFPRFFLDLADPERRIGAEYDGASHLDRGRLRQDRRRHNWLESHGWRMRYFTDDDLYRRPEQAMMLVAAAQRQAASAASIKGKWR